MNILIVGGTGILSTAVVKLALNQKYCVTVINRGRRPQFIPKDVCLIKSDKNNHEFIKSKIKDKKYDAIIDFLCYSKEELINSFMFYKNYTNQYVFISSCGVYNYSLEGPFYEDSPKVLTEWEYSIEKWECEQKLIELAKKTNINYTIIRPNVNYGDTRIPYGIVPEMGKHWTFISRILNNKPIITWNEGKNKGNITHVLDFGEALVKLLGNPDSYNQSINVCGDECPSYRDILDTLSDILNKEVITIDIDPIFYEKELDFSGINRGLLKGGRAHNYVCSNKKIRNILPEFRPKIHLKEGLERTLNNYKKNNYQDGIDWCWDGETDRIIKKWCKIQGITTESMNLHFVDYLNDATYKDRIKYLYYKHKNNFIIKILKQILLSTKKIIS